MQAMLDQYTVEVDSVSENYWYEIVRKFRDANIYQTWAYGAVRFGEGSLSHMIVRKNEKLIGAAQTRIVKIPLINAGIAYVRWGPLWRKYDSEDNLEDFRSIVCAMRQEYVNHQGLYLRIIPNEIENCQGNLRVILEEEGFKWKRSDYRTLYLSLVEPLETIKSNMNKNWRKNLNKAEKQGLTIVEGTEPALLECVDRIFRETVSRKGFVPGINIDDYHMLQKSLPDHIKMRVMICQSEGQPVAGLVGSAMGDVGIELIAATSNDGLNLGGSYLLRWKMINYLKQCGCRYYNLNGINPDRNPGGYQFKSGLCGSNGLDTEFIGTFEASENALSSLAVKLGEMMRKGYTKVKKMV
jgi:hypothetical protein